jgi:hypothetical protein
MIRSEKGSQAICSLRNRTENGLASRQRIVVGVQTHAAVSAGTSVVIVALDIVRPGDVHMEFGLASCGRHCSGVV